MSKKEQIVRLLQQISGQHDALGKAYQDMLTWCDAGGDIDERKLESIAELYWQLRSDMTRMSEPSAEAGGISLDFV